MKKVKKGEIWTAILDVNLGSEQAGVRPVVIIQNDRGNVFSPTTIIASVTSKNKKADFPTHVSIENNNLKYRKSVVMLEQVKTIDKILLGEKIGELTPEELKDLNRKIKISFDV